MFGFDFALIIWWMMQASTTTWSIRLFFQIIAIFDSHLMFTIWGGVRLLIDYLRMKRRQYEENDKPDPDPSNATIAFSANRRQPGDILKRNYAAQATPENSVLK